MKHRVYSPDTSYKELLCDTLIKYEKIHSVPPNRIVLNINVKESVIIELFGRCKPEMLKAEIILNHVPISFSNSIEYAYLVRHDGYTEYL